MGLFVKNTQIRCVACGCGPFWGKESSNTQKNGSIFQECSWICPRCNRLARRDNRIVEPENKKK